MKFGDSGLKEKDSGSSGGGSAWTKDRTLVGYTINIHEVKPRHVEEFYLPSGDLVKEHDEVILIFSFADESDAQAVFLGDYVPNGRYATSTSAKRIREVLEHITGDMMPLEEVVICVDLDSRYQQLYLGEAGSGQAETYASTHRSEPTRPTGNGQSTAPSRPSSNGQSASVSRNSQQRSGSAQR
jgi:hypothetical protein